MTKSINNIYLINNLFPNQPLFGLKKYRTIKSSNSSLFTLPFLFLSMICTYEAMSVAVGWNCLFMAL